MKNTKPKSKPVKVYTWKAPFVDGKVSEKIMGASHPGCCKQ